MLRQVLANELVSFETIRRSSSATNISFKVSNKLMFKPHLHKLFAWNGNIK